MSFLSKILFLSVAFVSPGIAVLALETNHKWAVVEFSANFMREAPDYAAELGDQALMGTVVEILDKSGYWVKNESRTLHRLGQRDGAGADGRERSYGLP